MIIVAVAQFCAREDVEANLATILQLIEEAASQGARLVILPEATLCPPPGIFDPTPLAQHTDGPFARRLSRAAHEFGLYVVFGMFTPSGDGRIFNTVLTYDPDGQRVARYDKLHLYDAFSARESDQVVPGPASISAGALTTFDIDGMRFGIATCYDLRFPEQFRALVDLGVEAVVLPAAWIPGPNKHSHWFTLTRARAIENSVYILAADQVPPTAIGHSTIVDPDGVTLAELGEAGAVAVSTIARESVEATREKNPSIFNRRFAVNLRIDNPEEPQ